MKDAMRYLHNRITLEAIPFSDRGSRIMILRRDHVFHFQLAESWSEDHPQTFMMLELLDVNGVPLESAITTLPYRVNVVTKLGYFVLCFVDPENILLTLAVSGCIVRLTADGDTVEIDETGGLIFTQSARPLTIAYTTNSELPAQTVSSLDRKQQLDLRVDQTHIALNFNVTRTANVNRQVPNFETVLQAAHDRWAAWFEAVPDVPEVYRSQYAFAWWVLGINLIRLYSHPQREGLIPSKRGYVGVWNWDSYFHAIALRHAQLDLARDQFRILFDHQLPNGMIPDVIQDHGALSHTTDYGIDADITKPPLTAWAVWKLFEIDHNRAFLHEVYDALVRSQRWWFAEHDTDHNGLCEYVHPYSSGLDNSPLFDHGAPLESPDLTAYLILQYDTLAKIALEIGRGQDVLAWTEAAEHLTQRFVELRWVDDAGYFWAWCKGERITTRTPINLFPLITGRMPPHIAQKLVNHLTDPAQFWTKHPVPTVALDDPTFDPKTMWRGPVWININYLLIDGLQRAGFAETARELRRKTLDMMMSQPDIYEYYHPHTAEKPPRAVSVFGWSAALFIDLVLAEVSAH